MPIGEGLLILSPSGAEERSLQKRADNPQPDQAGNRFRYHATPEYFAQKYHEELQLGFLRKAAKNKERFELVHSRNVEEIDKQVSYYRHQLENLPDRLNRLEGKRARAVFKSEMLNRLASKIYQSEGPSEQEIQAYVQAHPDIKRKEVRATSRRIARLRAMAMREGCLLRGESVADLDAEDQGMVLEELHHLEEEEGRPRRSLFEGCQTSFEQFSRKVDQLLELREEQRDALQHKETDGQRAVYLRDELARLAEGESSVFDLKKARLQRDRLWVRLHDSADVEDGAKLARGMSKAAWKTEAVLQQDVSAMHSLAQTYVDSAERHAAKYRRVMRNRPRIVAKRKGWQEQVDLAKEEAIDSGDEEIQPEEYPGDGPLSDDDL